MDIPFIYKIQLLGSKAILMKGPFLLFFSFMALTPFAVFLNGQSFDDGNNPQGYKTISLLNPSFEGTPAAGTNVNGFQLSGWNDCAPYYFRGQTPPDIQPGDSEFFDVNTVPVEGGTYLGMVTRQNETWELVSQRLSYPLEKGNCYSFEIHLSRSETYFSRLLYNNDTTQYMNFNKPIVLRIWGGRNVYEKRELLAESDVISHSEWRTYAFEFKKVKQDHDYLILEAFYKTPTLLPYNGNILLDQASQIQQICCPGEEPLIAMQEIPETKVKKKNHRRAYAGQSPQKKKKTDLKDKAEEKIEKDVIAAVTHKPRILKQLDKSKIHVGQTIGIDRLYFKADSSNFTQGSYEVLDEIYSFLSNNPSIVIEIGGHTNGIPGRFYCQSLSLKRAKSVAEYLYDKGISEKRIIYKGYGKDKPIATNKTEPGRRKNQRVELKILKTG